MPGRAGDKARAIVGVAACMTRSGTRSLTALYVAAPFSMGYVDFYTFLMPLYALSLGFDAAEVGILVGARSIVGMFLSIHIGVLMDRFGTRKVTLFFVWTSMVLAPLFPLVPWFWSLLALQLVNGAAVSFAWSGAQNTDRAVGHRRGALSRAVYILRATRFDHCANARRRGVGFRRHLAVLYDRRRMGRRADRRLAVCPRGGDLRLATPRGCGARPVPRPRCLAPVFRLLGLADAARHSGDARLQREGDARGLGEWATHGPAAMTAAAQHGQHAPALVRTPVTASRATSIACTSTPVCTRGTPAASPREIARGAHCRSAGRTTRRPARP